MLHSLLARCTQSGNVLQLAATTRSIHLLLQRLFVWVDITDVHISPLGFLLKASLPLSNGAQFIKNSKEKLGHPPLT